MHIAERVGHGKFSDDFQTRYKKTDIKREKIELTLEAAQDVDRLLH